MFFSKKKKESLQVEHVWVYCFNPSYENDPDSLTVRVFRVEEDCVEAIKEDVLELAEDFFMEEKDNILPTTKVHKMLQFLKTHDIYACNVERVPVEG